MKERPILFSADMVKAILEGKKTQTRRVMKPQPDNELTKYSLNGAINWRDESSNLGEYPYGNYTGCPYGQVGDRLWVRETYWQDQSGGLWGYKAGGIEWPPSNCGGKAKPSIHMPRWASRINLEITGIRVERLQEITEIDALNEGAEAWYKTAPNTYGAGYIWDSKGHIMGFARLWNSINKPPYDWGSNPFVWVIEFKRYEQ